MAICGSMHFFTEIKKLQKGLEEKGFTVFTPSKEDLNIDYTSLSHEEQINLKRRFIDTHIEKIKQSDAILVANYKKNGIENYIGANTFMEIAFAYILGKQIFILNEIPDQPNTLEIEGMKPVVLFGNISNITV